MNHNIAALIITAYLIVTAVGWIGNGFIVIATTLNKKLHRPCNLMIAFESFCELFHQSGHIVTAYYIYSGNYFVSTERCFQLQVVPNFFMNVGCFLNLCIGIDRLLSILCPMFYLRLNKKLYAIVMTTPAVCYGFVLMLITYFKKQHRNVICLFAAIYTGPAQNLFVFGLALNFITVVLYLVLWIALYRKGAAIYTKKLVQSLTIIVAFFVCGWLLTMITFSAKVILNLHGAVSFYTVMSAGVFVNISVACNFFVLNKCSSEYKEAFHFIMHGMKHPTSVAPTHVSTQRTATGRWCGDSTQDCDVILSGEGVGSNSSRSTVTQTIRYIYKQSILDRKGIEPATSTFEILSDAALISFNPVAVAASDSIITTFLEVALLQIKLKYPNTKLH